MGRLLALMVVAAASLLQHSSSLPQWSALLGLTATLGLSTFAVLWLRHCGFFVGHVIWLTGAAKVLTLLLAFTLSFGWAAWRAEQRLLDRLSAEHENVVSRVVFRVTGMVQDQGDSLRFQARVLSEHPMGIPREIQIVWRKSVSDQIDQALTDQVEPGQVWRAALIFRRPRGALNPHGFDIEGHMLSRNIRAIGRVRGTPTLLRHEPFYSMEVVVARTRQRLRNLMRKHVEKMSFGAVLIALAIGDQDSVKAEHWEIFNKTGITHLVSISGSHVTMLAAFGGLFTLWGWKRLRWRGRLVGEWIPAKVMAGLVALLVAWVYCLLAGWGVPARRTFFMLLVSGLALISRLPVSPTRVLCLAAATVTLIDPWSPMATGFWLSFGAVAVLFFVGAQAQLRQDEQQSRIQRGWFVIKESARLQWIITLAMLPVLAFLFQQVSLSSPLANAVAIPVITFIVTPLALLTALTAWVPGLDPFAGLMAWLAHLALDWSMIPVTWLAHTPWSSLTIAAMPGWCLVLSVFGIAWALQPPGVPVRWIGWTLLLPALTWPPERPAYGEWELSALDVGQGGAVLVRTQQHVVLFDAGPRMGVSDAGQRVIAPVLRAMGHRHLDALMVSHADIDHAGGLPGLLKEIPVKEAYASFALSAWLDRYSSVTNRPLKINYPDKMEFCEADQQWTWDGVVFTVLHPARLAAEPESMQAAQSAVVAKKKKQSNASSCVLHIQGQYHSALLPGDIGIKEEEEIFRRSIDFRRADVVVVAHHGSLTSSSQRFIQRVGAQHAIAQAGYLNRFSHPIPAIEQRWQAAGVRFWRTDVHGAVTVQSEVKGLKTLSESNKNKKYWHERDPPFVSTMKGH